ncbi:MAG TPA: cysteine--tRNA ligase [bacterium]|jgi:cysteinyl-tRNA synthetase|nr:cysteine--tRNA ligase [bacterium]
MPTLKLYNTRTRSQEPFEPRVAGQVGLYCCGPTVYHDAHIGNLRTFVFADLVVRALRLDGLEVNHVCNITDVGHLTGDTDAGEDKMEQGARRENRSVWDIAAHYTRLFLQDLARLNTVEATHRPKATDYIPQQIAMVQGLLDKGHAYVGLDGVYFDVASYPRYADFARKDLKGQEAAARTQPRAGLRNHEDFALWKLSPKDSRRLMEWDSPWGKGFPGWHIECSAMSLELLGPQFDIHCGAIDLIPVHHTNEIAQSEAYLGVHPWVNLWMHGEFLILDKGKMSKTGGDFLTLQSLLDRGYEALDYRFLCLGTHYRAPLHFSFEALDGARAGRLGLKARLAELDGVAPAGADAAKRHPLWARFWEQTADDLNAPRALAVVWETAKHAELDPALKAALILAMDAWLGLDLLAPRAPKAGLDPEEEALLAQRAEARARKDWARGDELRRELERRGIMVKDAKDGQRWERGAGRVDPAPTAS